jgi:hypothetical protein
LRRGSDAQAEGETEDADERREQAMHLEILDL